MLLGAISALIAQGAVTGGDSPYVLIWFFLFIFGILFIALALRGDQKTEQTDDSVRALDDQRALPLKCVRDALRPPRPPKRSQDSPDGTRPRTLQRTGGPRGLVR